MNENDMEYKSIKEIYDNKRIYYDVLGGITHENFWTRKHYAPKGIKCNVENLKRVCHGESPEIGDPLTDSKTQILQQNNYIISKDELLNIKLVLSSIKARKKTEELFATIFNSI